MTADSTTEVEVGIAVDAYPIVSGLREAVIIFIMLWEGVYARS